MNAECSNCGSKRVSLVGRQSSISGETIKVEMLVCGTCGKKEQKNE